MFHDTPGPNFEFQVLHNRPNSTDKVTPTIPKQTVFFLSPSLDRRRITTQCTMDLRAMFKTYMHISEHLVDSEESSMHH